MPAFDLRHWLAHRLALVAGAALLEFGCILRAAAPLADADPDPAPSRSLEVTAPRLQTGQRSSELAQVRVDTMLARPLFTPGRTPPRTDQGAQPAPVTLPRLAGLVISGGERRAIFAAPDGQRPVVVAEGSRLGPFTVTAIGPGTVELSGPAGIRTLRPSSDAGLRSQSASKGPIMARIDPVRRELETESDQ